MIKRRTKYEVFGAIFDTLKEAKKHYDKMKEVEKIRALLPKYKDEGCSFANGEGYIQLTDKQVKAFQKAIGKYLTKHHKGEVSKTFKKYPRSYLVGRTLDDSGSLLYSVYITFLCIDDENRLWGQPYYATHPSEGKQVRLNK